MEKWRLISDPPLPGEINMERDLQIMQEVSSGQAPPTLRFYRWSPPALSLGFSQNVEKVADPDACRRLNIDIMRPTGGRAVLHHRELTYSITGTGRSQAYSTWDHSILQIFEPRAFISF